MKSGTGNSAWEHFSQPFEPSGALARLPLETGEAAAFEDWPEGMTLDEYLGAIGEITAAALLAYESLAGGHCVVVLGEGEIEIDLPPEGYVNVSSDGVSVYLFAADEASLSVTSGHDHQIIWHARSGRGAGGFVFMRCTSSTALHTVILAGLILTGCGTGQDWRTARRDSAGIAPDPEAVREAVLQVYGARAWSWRGWFAIHTWIAAKRSGEAAYTVYDVVGWRGRRGQPVMRIARDVPDRYWFGARPRILKEHRGEGGDELIAAVDRAARAYPWKTTYEAFPGPNSNTFVAWIGRQVPVLGLDLPWTAIGRSYGQ